MNGQPRQPLYAGVEAGGTKFVCVVGTGPDDVRAVARIDVTTPAETIRTAIAFIRDAIASGTHVDAIGIASFGPVELRAASPRHGFITSTPKPGWAGVDMKGPFVDAFGLPVGFDTDVNGAALAELRWGAARGLHSFVYLTVGTGIGGGAVVDGRLVHGLGHPEMGHVAVPSRPGDEFPGRCPFHGGCWEGMGCGLAIRDRFGRRAEDLTGAERDEAAAITGWYLAAGIRSIIYTLAPERFVVGGGLASMPGVLEAARTELVRQLASYPGLPEHGEPAFITPAALGGMAGPTGTFALAERALTATAREADLIQLR